MKIFAYYLPQFHCIPENDKWWGKGFTEWVNVKKAKPLYKKHIQPKEPLNDNYYSLDNIKTLKWQSDLMNKYNVDGLIFYHYYFKGKKLLEKPAEMLLNEKNIKMKFFFCWANHDWYKSWDGTKEMLQKQEYGSKNDWKEHFNYLLEFFKDERYEKKNNKPLLMIYNSDFKEKKDMFNFFNEECIKNGFDGIFLIESKNNDSYLKYDNLVNVNYSCSFHHREPTFAIEKYTKNIFHIHIRLINKIKRIAQSKNIKTLIKYNGVSLYKTMCKNNKKYSNIINGCFFEWDNTPRHSYRGYVITPVSKKMFFKYYNSISNREYLFINAWNEWAEGMMLEPTKYNKYKYLEWIREAKENENRINRM